MGRNSKSSKCNPVCEKILKALAGYPNFIRFRPLPNRQEEPKNEAPPPLEGRIKDNKELVRSHSLQIHAHEDNNVATKMKKKQKPIKLEQPVAKVADHGHGGEKQIGGDKAGKKSGEDVNDVFSDYITRAKRRLGSISIKRHDSGNKGKENVKDDQRFSDYIIRAKNKLRATSSSVGWSKGTSIKRA